MVAESEQATYNIGFGTWMIYYASTRKGAYII